MVRRAFLGFLIVLLVFTAVPGQARAAIQDVTGTRFAEAVQYLKGLGVVEGRPEGFFPLEPITRAEATKIIVTSLGKGYLAPLLAGAPSFKDVPVSHWACGYIALAKNMAVVNGFPDGTFKPESLVTYAEYAKMLVEAAGLDPTAGLTWPANYVDAAARAGMVASTGFQANEPAIRGDCAIMTAFTIKKVPNPSTGKTLGQSVFNEVSLVSLRIDPETPTVAIGAAFLFAIEAKDEKGNVVDGVAITWSTSDPAKSTVNSSGRFSATHPGTYTVTARAGDLTATATVKVYGNPIALKATISPATVVANNVSTAQITVEVVDSSGTRVPVATNAVTVSYETSRGAVSLPSVTTLSAVNGVTTFTVKAKLLDNVTDKLKLTSPNLTSTSVSIKSIAQVATGIKLTAEPAQLPSNQTFFGSVTAQVVDQADQPMRFGTYQLTFSITGQGFLEGARTPLTMATVDQIARVEVSSEAGLAGSFRVTATGTNLRAASVTVPTYISSGSRMLKVTAVDTTGATGGVNDMKVTVGLYDSQGRPSIADRTIIVEFVPPEGSGLTGLNDLVFGVGDSAKSREFEGTKTGTFTVTVRDTDTSSSAVVGTSFTCTVSALTVSSIDVTPYGDPVIYLPLSNPKVTLTAQLEDTFGNPVMKSGVKLRFEAAVNGTGSVSWSTVGGKVTTDSAGRASITMTGAAYYGNRYTVTVLADTDNDGHYDDASGATAHEGIRITDAIPAQINVVFKNPSGTVISSVAADASQEAYCHITLKDSLGNVVEKAGLDVEVTISNNGRNVLDGSIYLAEGTMGPATGQSYVHRFKTSGDGQVTFGFQGGLADSFTVTVKCLNTTTLVSRQVGFRTNVGTAVAKAMVLKTDNTPASAINVSAGSMIQLKLALTDNGGNPVPAPGNMHVLFDCDRPSGEYRLSQTGAAATQADFTRGTSYRPIYYIDTASATGVNMADDADGYTAYNLDLTWKPSENKVAALVTAADGTPVPGVTVKLRRTAGGGQFTGGVTTIIGITNSSGVFSVSYSDTVDETVQGELLDGRNMAGGLPVGVSDTVSF